MNELILRSIKGDKEAYSELIKLIQNDLFKVAQARLENVDDSNDAIQETLVIAYNSLKKLKQPEFFKTWIIKILINECNKIYRNNQRRINILDKLTKKDIKNEYEDDKVIDIDNKMELDNILKGLNYNEKICLLLFYGSKYSLDEISEILNVKKETVKTRIKRTKQKLRKVYGERRDNESATK